MSAETLISVCIATYNGEQTLKETIQSVLDQTHQHFEIIISDDGSTDGTQDIINSYSDPRIKAHFNSTNVGMSHNWQQAIMMAEGEFVINLGHDDMLLPNCMERVLETFATNKKTGMVAFCANVIPQNVVNGIYANGHLTDQEALPYLKALKGSAPSQIFYRTKAVKEANGYDTGFNYCPEISLAMRITINGWHTCNLDEILGTRTAYANRVTAKVKKITIIKDRLRFLNTFKKHYTKEEWAKQVKPLRKARFWYYVGPTYRKIRGIKLEE
jgi:glycosyltransferase involved in cell wall biosynthesis